MKNLAGKILAAALFALLSLGSFRVETAYALDDRSGTYTVSTPRGTATVIYETAYGQQLQTITISRSGQSDHVFVRDYSSNKVRVSIGGATVVTCQIVNDGNDAREPGGNSGLERLRESCGCSRPAICSKPRCS